MSLLAQIWTILTPVQRHRLLAMQLVSLLMAASTTVGVAAIAPFFAVLGDPRAIDRMAVLHWLYTRGGFVSEGSFVWALGTGFVALVFVSNLVSILGLTAMSRFARRTGAELQTSLFAEYLSWPYASHIDTHSATLFNNVMHETTRVTLGVLQNLFMAVTSAVTIALIVASLLVVKPLVAVALAMTLGGGYAVTYLLVRKGLARVGHDQSRFAVLQGRLASESFDAIREIIVRGVQEYFRGRFAAASREYFLAASKAQLLAQTPRYLMEFIAAAGLVALALLLSHAQRDIGALLGLLTFVVFASYRLLPSLQQLFASVVRIRSDRVALHLIGTDLAHARSSASRRSLAVASRLVDDWARRPARAIELSGVSYRYAGGRGWALQDIGMRIPAGGIVGLMGANGSGKSTLMDMIAGLLVPTCGRVQIDDCVLGEHNLALWQSRLAYVPQSVALLDGSIAENIAFGIEPQAVDQVQLLRAARLARLDELIASLPQGVAQRVGQRGLALSGGQRQRIGVARALYAHASVLLLDEATSSLDGCTEQDLIATLSRLRGSYTVVIIAHGLHAMRRCDRLYYLEQGRLTASGTYEELLCNSGGFRQLAGAAQAG